MTEQHLQQAAACLPVPADNFYVIEAKARERLARPSRDLRRVRRLCAVCIAVFLLAGCAAWAATTDVSYSAWATHSISFRDTEHQANKLDLVLPEVLADSSFYQITTMHVVPDGTTYLEALLKPIYRWYDVSYAIQEAVTVQHENSVSQPVEPEQEISIGIGSTENPLWRYCFEFNEDNLWVPDSLIPGSYQAIEYEGQLLQMGTTSHYWEATGETTYSNWLHWIDEPRGACIGISADTDFDTLIEYAQHIIDLNP